MNKQHTINQQRARRTKRTRAKLLGTSTRPRLAVFRSNRFISAQLIDDSRHATLACVSTKDASSGKAKLPKSEQALIAGEVMASKIKAAGVSKVVLDRRSYRYHGRVKSFAEGVRKGGIEF